MPEKDFMQKYYWVVCELCRMGYAYKRDGDVCGDNSSHNPDTPCTGIVRKRA